MNLPKTTFRFIFHFIREQPVKFSVLILSFIGWGFNDSLFPYFLKRIVNTLQAHQNAPETIYTALDSILILLVAFWVTSEILMRTQGILQIYTFPKLRARIRETVFHYVQSHSHDYFSSHFAGNIAKKLSDLPTSCQTLIEIICFQFITATTGVIVVFITMWHTKPFFALLLLIWICVHFTITLLFLKKGNHHWKVHADAVSVLSGKIVDTLTNILNVKLFARSRYESAYLKAFQQDEIRKAKKAMRLVEIMHIGLGLNGLFLIFGMTFLLLHGWTRGFVTLGDFTQIEMQSFWLLGWIWFVSFQLTVFARETGTIADALSLIQKSHDLTDKKNALPLNIEKGHIFFDNITFGYKKNKPVFKQFSVKINACEKIGLVGFSGSGKSTFVNLLMRFYDLQSGHIFIDNQDIANVTQESLRGQIAMIPQDPSLFHRSLMENIRYGRLDASDAEVIDASKRAHCHEFIEKLDEGYESLVGERGIKLSGGQRQRIAIARALLKNAPILILDEATSSLDSVTEKLIQQSLQDLMRSKTTLVIAHRLSTLSNMDRILVFHEGKIIEDGSKASLLNSKGHFAKLWNMQTDGFLPDK